MTYAEKLQHPKWQRRRLDILTRDNFSCQLCSDTETSLHIHHKYYESNCEVWEYPDEALITYCKHCHAATEHMKDLNCFVSSPLVAAKRRSAISNDVWITAIASHIEHGLFATILQYSSETNSIIHSSLISEAIAGDIKDLLEMSKKLL